MNGHRDLDMSPGAGKLRYSNRRSRGTRLHRIRHYSAPRRSHRLGNIAMLDLCAISGRSQVFVDLFGNHDRAVMAARAAEGDSQIALALMNVMRQQVDQQLGDSFDELGGLWEG